jgi:hypothetical protein
MIFFINRDALFNPDNLFPINFFAVYVYEGAKIDDINEEIKQR